jgi:predicted transposase YbfD/YdcC
MTFPQVGGKMSETQTKGYRILSHFSICEDPRKHRIRHELIDIIVIVVLSVLCGEEGWDDMYDWAQDKIIFLREFLSLKHDIPSADTIRRVMERIDPERFLEAFLNWATELSERKSGQICIDGKTLKKALDERGALHLVSAFAADNGLTLGIKDSGGKGKEIPTIKELLNSLSLKTGDIITIDAIGCQQDIVTAIRKQKADYLIALKMNQERLFSEVRNFFEQALNAEEDAPVETFKRDEQAHGRYDFQKIWISKDLDWLKDAGKWRDLRAIICVERKWTASGKENVERRYYISSADKTAEEFGLLVRRHWAIENEYHWHLDVTFKEDDSEIGARSNRVLRIARTISLQLLKAESTKGLSIRRKKRRCHRSEAFLRKVLCTGNF